MVCVLCNSWEYSFADKAETRFCEKFIDLTVVLCINELISLGHHYLIINACLYLVYHLA